jgi:hypothetical protein
MAEITETIRRKSSSEDQKEFEKQRDKYIADAKKQSVKKISSFIRPVNVVGSNVSAMQRPPMNILSKEQAMLNALFGQKHQLWGGNNPVQINNTLTTGNGLINTGSGNATRRLFLP